MRTQALIAAALLAAALQLSDQAQAMSGEDLRRAVAGRTVVLKTVAGDVRLTYRRNGTVVGRASAVFSIVAGDGRSADRGLWYVRGRSLCQRWSHWMGGRRHCYRMRRDGKIIRWHRDDGRSGVAWIEG